MAGCAARSAFLEGACKFPVLPTMQRKRCAVGAVTMAMRSTMDSHLVLGIDHSASRQEIKRAYRSLALQYHPDVCKGSGTEHIFAQINLAYECLMKDYQAAAEQDRCSAAVVRDEWLSEGFTFEEIFGGDCYREQVEESVFEDVKVKASERTVKKSCTREDW